MKQRNQANWWQLTMALASLLALSFGLAYLLQNVVAHFELQLKGFAWLAYLSVFATTLVCNFTVIVPVPIATSIMIAAATKWDLLTVALAASIGGTLGELSGYYAGYFGKIIAIPEETLWYKRIKQWMQHYVLWAIFFLALQPLLPFDIGGLIAGASKMPLYKFLTALWMGKFAKYTILCYYGIGLIHLLPFWSW